MIFGAGLIFAGSLSAQMTPGLIGTRYVEASMFVEDIQSSGIDSGTGILVRANVPVAKQLDAAVLGTFESIDTASFREKQLGASLAAHWGDETKAFLDLSVVNVWQSSKWAGVKYSDNNALYAVGIGMEAPVSDATAAFFRISFNRYFDDDLGDYMLYTIGVNHRLNERLFFIGSVAFREDDSIYYNFGLGVKF